MSRPALKEDYLRQLIADGVAREFRVQRAEAGGWQLSVRVGLHWRVIRSQREAVRIWASLDTLERFATGLGILLITWEL